MRPQLTLVVLLSLLYATADARPANMPQIVITDEVNINAADNVSPFPHDEPVIAASTTDPNLLVAAASALPAYGEMRQMLYVSHDRGVTWHTVWPLGKAGGDPMLAAGPRGEFYFMDLEARAVATSYVSTDGARTWSKPFGVTNMDRESIVVDQKRFPGRLYVSGSAERLLYRSNDHGHTFAPTQNTSRPCMPTWATVSADGSVLVPCVHWTKPYALGVVVSKDGGKTLSPMYVMSPFQADLATMNAMAPALNSRKIMLPAEGWLYQCTADLSGRYPNRVYCAWPRITDRHDFVTRIVLSASDDDGITWSKPRVIDISAPAWAAQLIASLAVNKAGTLGITWLDTRQSKARDRYDEYFATSFDGGRSFTIPARVSSESSFPLGNGNMQLTAEFTQSFAGMKPAEKKRFGTKGDFLNGAGSLYSDRPAGGDYFGMTADKLGAFHPVWSDARTGVWQTYTARIQVAPQGSAIGEPLPAERRICGSLSGKIALHFDHAFVDPRTLEIDIWARLRNVSKQSLYGPFNVTVNDLSGDVIHGVRGPVILNASNGVHGTGARFDFINAAGPYDELLPGDVTKMRRWRLRALSPRGVDVRTGSTITGCYAK